MATRQYIGARYVPKFANPIEWSKDRSYEALTVVTYFNNSYTSKQSVPIGIDINNKEYWVNTGNYNAQVEEYRKETESVTNILKSAMTSVKDFGATGNGVSDDTTAIINAMKYVNENGGYLYFPKGTYIVSETIFINNSCNIVGDNFNNTVIITNKDIPIFKNALLNNEEVYALRDTSFINLTLSGTNKKGVGVEISNDDELCNLPFFRFNNVHFTNLNKGVYLEGYGHTFYDCYFGSNNVGVALVHPEQVCLENCWIEYNNIGITTNVEKQKYGHNFRVLSGSIQRNTIGAKILNTDDVYIDTYCEINTESDLQFGDKNDSSNYTKGCHNINVNINTSKSNAGNSVEAYATTYGNIYVNAYTDMIPVTLNGYCKYINSYLYGRNNAILTGDSQKYCKVYFNNFLTTVPSSTQNIQSYNAIMDEVIEYRKNTNMVTKKFNNSGEYVLLSKSNNSNCTWADEDDDIMNIVTDADGKKAVRIKHQFLMYDGALKDYKELRINNNKLQFYANGKWNTVVTE